MEEPWPASCYCFERRAQGPRWEGRKVFPYKFLLKHYPVRSQRHGDKKILRDRQPRWSPAERAEGWHSQYDHVGAGHSFLRDARALWLFDEGFNEEFLVERLSGVGAFHPIRRRAGGADELSILQQTLAAQKGAAQTLAEQLRLQQQHITNIEAELTLRRHELERIHRSTGWRLLSRYGTLKYRYLRPVYRALGLRADGEPPVTGS